MPSQEIFFSASAVAVPTCRVGDYGIWPIARGGASPQRRTRGIGDTCRFDRLRNEVEARACRVGSPRRARRLVRVESSRRTIIAGA